MQSHGFLGLIPLILLSRHIPYFSPISPISPISSIIIIIAKLPHPSSLYNSGQYKSEKLLSKRKRTCVSGKIFPHGISYYVQTVCALGRRAVLSRLKINLTEGTTTGGLALLELYNGNLLVVCCSGEL